MAKYIQSDKTAIRAAITTAKTAGKQYNQDVQALGLQVIGHALAHGGAELANALVNAMNTKPSAGMIQSWLIKHGPFTVDENKALVLDKSKRAGLLNGAKPTIEAAEKAMAYISKDVSLWWVRAEKAAPAVPDEFDCEDALDKALARIVKKRGELGAEVTVLNASLLDTVVQLVKAYKADTDAAVDATDEAKAEVLMNVCISAAKSSAAQCGVDLEEA